MESHKTKNLLSEFPGGFQISGGISPRTMPGTITVCQCHTLGYIANRDRGLPAWNHM